MTGQIGSENIMSEKPGKSSFLAGTRTTALLLAVVFGPPGAAAFAAGDSTANPPPKLNLKEEPLRAEIKTATSLAPVIKKIAPSVVNIYSTMTIRERATPDPFFDSPLFRHFFGDQLQPRERKAQSLGSGIIVTSDGYILTANHVIEGADKVKVALASGEKEYDARIIGADPATDVAVLKIEAKGLPAAVVGDSDKLEVGDAVLAIGNPFAVGQTVTRGIVSATGRGGFGIPGYENFIQTDAAINPGNSGGALADAEGRLVGINTWIYSRTGGYQGIGFAVPINMARYVMEHLTRDGRVTRGFLGIFPQPLTMDLAKAFHLPDDSSGVMVGEVEPNTPADKAGLKNGDVIVEINGKKMTDPRTLVLFISQTAPGSRVTLRILRTEPGKAPMEKTLAASLTEKPEEGEASRLRNPQPDRSHTSIDGLDGVEVTDIDTRTRRQLGIPNNVRGALVSNVEQDSNAAKAGLQPGDVILEIDRQPVRNAQDAVTLSERAKGDSVLLRVWSNGDGGPGGIRYVPVNNKKRR